MQIRLCCIHVTKRVADRNLYETCDHPTVHIYIYIYMWGDSMEECRVFISCVTLLPTLPVFILYDSLHSKLLVFPPPRFTDSPFDFRGHVTLEILRNKSMN